MRLFFSSGIRTGWVLIMCVIGLSSCISQTRSTTNAMPSACTKPLEYSQAITSNSVLQQSGSVAALDFLSNNQSLLVAYDPKEGTRPGKGKVVEFRLSDLAPVRFFDIGYLDLRRTRLNADANLLVSVPLRPLRVWNTGTGKEVYQDSAQGDPPNDIYLSKDGTWILEGDPGGYSIFSPSKRVASGSGGSELGAFYSGGTVALNRTNDLIAHGTERERHGKIDGLIGIDIWDGTVPTHRGKWFLGFWFSDFGTETDLAPLKMEFDPQSQWLGVLTKESVDLFDVASLGRKARANLATTSFGSISFNPSASLLAVGYSRGMRVYEVPQLNEVLDKSGPEVTSVSFSPDGCLLAWGDVEGTVHIINAPKP